MFIDDIVNISLTLAVNCPEPLINVGTGSDVSFKEVVAIINKYLKKTVQPVYAPKPKIYLERTTADTTLLRKYYKKKFTPLEVGIKAILESFNSSSLV